MASDIPLGIDVPKWVTGVLCSCNLKLDLTNPLGQGLLCIGPLALYVATCFCLLVYQFVTHSFVCSYCEVSGACYMMLWTLWGYMGWYWYYGIGHYVSITAHNQTHPWTGCGKLLQGGF